MNTNNLLENNPLCQNNLLMAKRPSNLLEAMARHAIGFDSNFFEQVASSDAPNFPPHNISEISEGVYQLTLAVAGFNETEIEIILHNDLLTVSGKKNRVRDQDGPKVLYRGIAFRDFSRQFKIGDYVRVDRASMEDGLLIIDLSRQIPENLKPKRIQIGI
jgi:molecular chaperone IbpA